MSLETVMNFHESETVELKKYTSELKEAGMILEREPQTEFEELGTHFIAMFKRKSYEATQTTGFGVKLGETTQKTSVKTSVKILEAIVQNNRITIPELAELAGVTERSIERNIQHLQMGKRLRRVGPDKGGHWEIVE
jgi:ATP-dependent DNA helicase RecG